MLGLTSEKLLQPAAAAEQINVEHQLVPGCYPQLLVDAPVMLSDRAHADKCQVRDIRDLVSIDVVAEDVPLCLCQQILPRHKLVKQLRDVGRELALLQALVSGPGVQELCQFIHFRDAGGQALFRQLFLLESLQAVGDGPDKLRAQEEGEGQQPQQQPQASGPRKRPTIMTSAVL